MSLCQFGDGSCCEFVLSPYGYVAAFAAVAIPLRTDRAASKDVRVFLMIILLEMLNLATCKAVQHPRLMDGAV